MVILIMNQKWKNYIDLCCKCQDPLDLEVETYHPNIQKNIDIDKLVANGH